MGECLVLTRQKLTKHKVPGGEAPKDLISIAGRPLTFPPRRSITLLRDLSVTAYFSDSVLLRPQINPDKQGLLLLRMATPLFR